MPASGTLRVVPRGSPRQVGFGPVTESRRSGWSSSEKGERVSRPGSPSTPPDRTRGRRGHHPRGPASAEPAGPQADGSAASHPRPLLAARRGQRPPASPAGGWRDEAELKPPSKVMRLQVCGASLTHGLINEPDSGSDTDQGPALLIRTRRAAAWLVRTPRMEQS
ncbi:unnamed protein product [Rangifer tarandus platyrhynchus]|uniref:Uncharacterized protein n=1 Tax=Rangifer tarandus platyrhynchus TaxID=3082113 RepID=A0ABN8ZDE4_RANTA|nr:unnamed protein product [Rangifer tarandus platyrhynchus]